MYAVQHAPVETHRGETFTLERRIIGHFDGRPPTRVWCWQVTSGPATGIYGGKCATKAEARTWARQAIEAWAVAA